MSNIFQISDIQNSKVAHLNQHLLSIAKHRNGSLAMGTQAIKLKAELYIQKFKNWDGIDDVKEGLGNGSWRPVISPNTHDDNPF